MGQKLSGSVVSVLDTVLGSFALFAAFILYCFGVLMKMTDHRPNTNGYDFLMIFWFMASLIAFGGVTLIFFPNLQF